MLYIVSTPIGNLSDISLRAIDVLKNCDVILAEDSRQTRKLLDFLEIKNKKIEPYYEQVEEQKLPLVADMLEKGMNIVLLTDAGTPLVSDPGFTLVSLCRFNNFPMTAIPGPTAVINALVLSGSPMDKFVFLGFLPKKSGKRIKILKGYDAHITKVVYESPYRLLELLEELLEVYGETCVVSICREMTKKFEEIKFGAVNDLIRFYRGKKIKGELTIVFYCHKGFKT